MQTLPVMLVTNRAGVAWHDRVLGPAAVMVGALGRGVLPLFTELRELSQDAGWAEADSDGGCGDNCRAAANELFIDAVGESHVSAPTFPLPGASETARGKRQTLERVTR
jgi:hypothetical protein